MEHSKWLRVKPGPTNFIRHYSILFQDLHLENFSVEKRYDLSSYSKTEETLAGFHFFVSSLCVNLTRLFLCDDTLHTLGNSMRAKQFLCFNNNII